MISVLLNSLDHRIVLTPNQRLAATLLKKYNQKQAAEDKTCWRTPQLHPLASWLQSLWSNYCSQEMASPFLILSPNQELILWEEIITETPESEQLLKLSELAKQANTAWSTLKKWRSNYYHPSFSLTENSRAFQSWAEKFAARCLKESWLDSASLTDLVIEKILNKEIMLPPQLLLLNFTEITPQQRELFQAAEQQGVALEFQTLSQNTEEEPPAFLGLSDENSEIQIMARWAKKILEEKPEATIGCIASSLEEKREVIIAVFTDLFGGQESFNISAGKTLASYPLIQHAFQLLNLPSKNVSNEILSNFLGSPFIGDAEKEMQKRIQFDSRLRRENITATSWDKLFANEKTPSTLSLLASCPLLATRLKLFLEERRTQQELQSISQWVHHFSHLLELLGWPGEQSLNSAEYQVVHCWMDLLKETAELANILQPLPASSALHYLTVLAAKAYFQPQSPEAPIQILGQLEGAGLPFDYLWVTGLDDTAWPPLPSPNPLLPHELQKALQMPNASALRQLDYSLKLTKQFKEAARTVIFSYSQHKEQEELRASPLIAELKPLALENLVLAPLCSSIQKVFLSKVSEVIHDEKAKALEQSGKIRGGASIFEMQAACPFKAFAKLRLNAYPLEEAEVGLPAKNRGSIVHRVLELLWTELNDQERLLQLDNETLELKLNIYIKTALQELAPFLPSESIYLALVKQRLLKLLKTWLSLEKARPPFRVIAREEKTTIKMNNLEFNLRVDRIDQLAEGQYLIIDYKTKKACTTQDWFGERLTEPQLPLYCISSLEMPVGLAYAQIHTSKTELKGLAQKDLAIAGVSILSEKTKGDAPSWEMQLEEWRYHLRELFEAFQSGQATVDPKNPQSCQHCDLQSLCRIHELASYRENT